jgi:acetyl-CoA C-acetyltransferase
MSRSVIVAGKRTAIGKLSGAFASLSAQELGGAAIKGVLDGTGVDPATIDLVLMGQVIQAGQGQITARQAAVKGGIPMSVNATTINKVCLSGLQTLYLADLMIRAGEADIVVAGGMESMTNAPYLLPGARAGYRLGDQKVVDSMMFDGLTCAFDQCAMGLATERYNAGRISRARQDEFSARSHQLAAAAIASGKFAEEIVPVAVPQRKGDPVMAATRECASRRRSSRWASCAGPSRRTARSPPAMPRRSPTAALRFWSCRPSAPPSWV